MKATVLHDEHGNIVAISKAPNLVQAGSKFTNVGMVAGPGQKKTEIDLSPEDNARPLHELHAAYRVDVATSKLMKAAR